MVVRRSLRTRSSSQQILKARDDNIKRKTDVKLPGAKRRKIDPTTSKNDLESCGNRRKNGRQLAIRHCPISAVVTAVLSDSPTSKCSSTSDEDDIVRSDDEDANKKLFKTDSTPKKAINPTEMSETPKSGGKFFKNRTPQKSKVKAARSKSISLIRQTCFGQKIKVKDKGRSKVKVSKLVPKYEALKFKNGRAKENMSQVAEIADNDTGIVMSDELSVVSVDESECNSLISGPVLPSPILSQSITQKLHLIRKPSPKVASPSHMIVSSQNNESQLSVDLSSASSPSMLSLQKPPDEIPTTMCQILVGSIQTRSTGSSPALSTRSQKSLKLFSSQEGESLTKGLASPQTRTRSTRSKSKQSVQERSEHGSAVADPTSDHSSRDSTIVSSIQPKSSQQKIAEILDEFMAGDDLHLSTKKSPAKTRITDVKRREVSRSPRKGSPVCTPQKSDEVILYPFFTKSPEPSQQKQKKMIADKRQEGMEQTALDFGQKDLGTTQCKTCRMVYNQKDPEDEKSHVAHHQRLLSALKFKGWKSERIAQQFGDGSRIIIVVPEDKQVQKKIMQIQQVVDKDLGFLEVDERPKYMKQTYLYISGAKRVEGYCVAEAITMAYPVLSETERSQADGGGRKAWCCSTEPVIAKCGISRVWVFAEARRQGIASKILDCVRYRFFMGVSLDRMDLAFTDPTPLGRAFATNYTGTDRFLVYK